MKLTILSLVTFALLTQTLIQAGVIRSTRETSFSYFPYRTRRVFESSSSNSGRKSTRTSSGFQTRTYIKNNNNNNNNNNSNNKKDEARDAKTLPIPSPNSTANFLTDLSRLLKGTSDLLRTIVKTKQETVGPLIDVAIGKLIINNQ